MTLILVWANVIGFLALGVTALKLMDDQVLSIAARVVLLGIVFLAIYAALEALSAKHAPRPGATLLIFACGLYAAWRVLSPYGVAFFTRRPGFTWTPFPKI